MLRLCKSIARNDAVGVLRAVSEGANPNEQGRDGLTPLMYAIFYPENLQAIAALLEAGADPNYRVKGDPCALGQAARFEKPDLLQVLLDHGGDPNLNNDEEPLTFTAAYSRRFDNMFLLLRSGADINVQKRISHQTLLLLLAGLDFWAPALSVVALGGDPLEPDGRGDKMAKLLAKARVSPSSSSWSDFSAFRDACADCGVPISGGPEQHLR